MIDLFMKLGFAQSKSECRKLIQVRRKEEEEEEGRESNEARFRSEQERLQ